MSSQGLGWGLGIGVLMAGKGLFETPVQWEDMGGDVWRLIEKETPSRNFIEDFRLVDLFRDLEMSSIF